MAALTTPATGTSRSPVRAMEILATIVIVVLAISVVATIIGRSGLGLVDDLPGDPDMTIRADIETPVDFGAVLATTRSDNGPVDAATGGAPVELGEPVSVPFTFTRPTDAARVLWVLWQIGGPIVGIAVTWLIRSIIRSVRSGDPFTRANERRLWQIAGLVGVGATVVSMLEGVARTFIFQRSAAADLVPIGIDISFLPLIAAGVIAVLATVWRSGVGLRDDVEGLV